MLGLALEEPGSVRVCASYCGLASILPTARRLPLGKFGPVLGR